MSSDHIPLILTKLSIKNIIVSSNSCSSSGTGSPESAITAPVGTIYARTDGDTTDAAYLKTSGTGSSGWERLAVKKYKEYVAIINQSGTSAPTATVINNELGGAVTFVYNSIGVYGATLTGAFTRYKTTVTPTNGDRYEGTLSGKWISDDEINLYCMGSGGSADDIITDATLIIRVYY